MGCSLSPSKKSDLEYRSVIPEMADTVGVSKSSVSRHIIEASVSEVETLLERHFDELKLVVIYIDGMVFGDHVMIGAVGVGAEGHKHGLAIREGATENATVVKELLEDLVARGVNPDQKRSQEQKWAGDGIRLESQTIRTTFITTRTCKGGIRGECSF